MTDVQGSGQITPPELSIVVPTFNERNNIGSLVKRVHAALPGQSWEIIFVDDDSPDGTHAVAKRAAGLDARVRCIRRIRRRGLSAAVIEGVLSSSSRYVAVMDGDLQHDEMLLGDMLSVLKTESIDVVIASRYIGNGRANGLDGQQRHRKSRLGNWIAQGALRVQASDPMSGFFMISRTTFDRIAPLLSGSGFKILLDLLASSPAPLKLRELPLEFRHRHSGDSKLDAAAELAFAGLLLDKTLGRFVPTRFVLFSIVGGTGVFVHLVSLKAIMSMGFAFAFAQGAAAVLAMTSNFWLNNAVTYRDRRLTGWHFVSGLLSFYAICSIGLVGNIGIANMLFSQSNSWWVAGLAGAAVGAVWNYAVSSVFTWQKR